MGEGTFFRIGQTSLREHEGRSASTADHAMTASRVAGEGPVPCVDGWVDGWVHGTKVPSMPGHPGWRSDQSPTS